jgi:hypothetical protein
MQQERNRVIEGMQEWKQKEQLIADLFSLSVTRSKYVQQLKLEHLYDLRKKHGNDLSKEERVVLRVLRGEIRDMEKRMYPSLPVRLVVKTIRAIKELMKPSMKKSLEETPAWKLKASTEIIPKQKEAAKLQQKVHLRPTLVQKKETGQQQHMKVRR